MNKSPLVEGLLVSAVFKKRLPAGIPPEHERFVRALVGAKLVQASLDGTDAILGVSALLNEFIKVGQLAYSLTDEQVVELLELSLSIAREIAEVI